jgi:hypothetical protein
VSFANKNVSGLQKCLRFQNGYNIVEIELRVVQVWTEIKLVITNRFCNHAFDFSPNCTPLSSITIIYILGRFRLNCNCRHPYFEQPALLTEN